MKKLDSNSLYFSLIILMLGSLSFLNAQPYEQFSCEVITDSSRGGAGGANRSVTNSENGWYLSPVGTINVLIVFAQIEYQAPAQDTIVPNGTPQWPLDDVPIWADDLVDNTALANPQGTLSKYFHQASSGQLKVIGDYLEAPTNNGIFTVSSTNQFVTKGQLASEVNNAMNGNFITDGGNTNPADFDIWSNASQPGLSKITPSMDNPGSYDHVMVIWRNHLKYNGGHARTGSFSFGDMVGHPNDTWSENGSWGGGMPFMTIRHEVAHMFLGGNNFHSAGGGSQPNYWIPQAGGHGALGGAGSALLTWNAWDRYRLGWDDPSDTYLISARQQSGVGTIEANGDLDASSGNGDGLYILRDFVETGDAIRIKLPFIDESSEYPQWLWLENHRGFDINANEFDKFSLQASYPCVEPVEPGLVAEIQIDRDSKIGSEEIIYDAGYVGCVRQLSADGMWERIFDSPTPNLCSGNGTQKPGNKVRANPLTGRADIHSIDLDQNSSLTYTDQMPVDADIVNGTVEFKTFWRGNPRQFFKPNGNNEISMGTNPPSSVRMSQAGEDSPVGSKNIRSVYLNGVEVEVLYIDANGHIYVNIRYDHVDIENDVNWMAPDIVLNKIPNGTIYSLNLTSGNTITLDHGKASTRMTAPIDFEGNKYSRIPRPCG